MDSVILTTVYCLRPSILHTTCLYSTLRKQEKRKRERNKQEEEAGGGPSIGKVGEGLSWFSNVFGLREGGRWALL